MNDKYEAFLTGHMTARKLTQEAGLDVVRLLEGLQSAHDRIVHREAQRLVLGIVAALNDGRIAAGKPSLDDVADLLDIDPSLLGKFTGGNH